MALAKPFYEAINFDEIVKSRKCSLSVIPAKAGNQCSQALIKPLDPVFQRGDDFLRSHQFFNPNIKLYRDI